MNMSDEMEKRKDVKSLAFKDLPALRGTSNLLAVHNASLAGSENSLNHFSVNTNSAGYAFETELRACITSGVVALLGGSGGLIMGVSAHIAFPVALGAAIVVVPTYIYGSKILNHMYLRYCMKSKNPKKRSYYVNKVLDFTLIDSINSELFRTPSVLGYSLWFHEKIRIIRSQNDNKAYKKAFSTTSSEDFKNDKLFLLYMNVAKDMISGTLDRECIPRIPQTESHKRLYEKYPEIIDSRPKDEGYLLTDAELSRESALEAELSSKPLEYRRKFESWKGRSEFDRPIMEAHAIQRMEKDAVAPSMEKSAIPFLDDFSSEMATLERIESEWFETQVDIVQVLKFPLFADMGSPLVQSFHTKLDIAKSLSKKTLGNDFITAVSKAKMAWNTLCYEAERIELSKFDKGERKKILMATNLMNIALNAASTPSERQSAYRKAMEQLKGLVVIPKSATRAIEEIVSRKELTAL